MFILSQIAYCPAHHKICFSRVWYHLRSSDTISPREAGAGSLLWCLASLPRPRVASYYFALNISHPYYKNLFFLMSVSLFLSFDVESLTSLLSLFQGSSYWLSQWTTDAARATPNRSTDYWMWTYIGWAAGEIFGLILALLIGTLLQLNIWQ